MEGVNIKVAKTTVVLTTIKMSYQWEVFNMLMNDLSIIVRHSNAFLIRKLQKYGVGCAEHVVLTFLAKNNGVNQESIAQFYKLDKGAVAKTLGKLEEKGYIIRKVNEENQREKIITLSKSGKEIITEMEQLLKEFNAAIFEGMSVEEIKTVEKLVGTISKNVLNHLKDGDDVND